MASPGGLPIPRVPEHQYLSAICGLLGEITATLTDIRDRLPEQATDEQAEAGGTSGAEGVGYGGAVELKEPAAPSPAMAVPSKAEPGPESATASVALTESTVPAKKTARAAAKKTTAARRRTSTKENG